MDSGNGRNAAVAAASVAAMATAAAASTAAAAAAAKSSDNVATLDGSNSSGRSTPSGGDQPHNKLFVGGLSWQTSADKLREYFGQYGTIIDVQVLKDPLTQVTNQVISTTRYNLLQPPRTFSVPFRTS